jgi:NAD(P)H-flavin reductase
MGADFTRAYIVCDGDAVKIRLHLSRHISVKAGQYIELWIPTISFGSLLQSHPFTVTSWSEQKQQYLDLLIEPRKGWTRKLLDSGKENEELLSKRGNKEFASNLSGLNSHLALFSGPHGISIQVADYETVLLVASGFGIASQLPYLRQLIYGYNACKTRSRRIHLVWQLETDGKHP